MKVSKRGLGFENSGINVTSELCTKAAYMTSTGICLNMCTKRDHSPLPLPHYNPMRG